MRGNLTLAEKHYTACPTHEVRPDHNARVREILAVAGMPDLFRCRDCQQATRETILTAIGGMRNTKPTYKGKWRYQVTNRRIDCGNDRSDWRYRLREWTEAVAAWHPQIVQEVA